MFRLNYVFKYIHGEAATLRALLCIFLLIAIVPPLVAQNEKKGKIKFSAEHIQYDEKLGNKARRLIGDVVFEHDGVLMYCDSAYHYPEANSLDAFSNVHIKQGDTLDLFGDSLKYNGNTKVARVFGNVRLLTKDMTLTTSQLTFYRMENYALYTTGGTLVNNKENNRLYSNIGYFYPNRSLFHFKDSVRLYNPEYTIETDTLHYNSQTEVTYFMGPTYIISEENLIYCENGWYDTKTNLSNYYLNAYLINEKQKLEGESMFFYRNAGYGKVMGNVQITDTIEDIIINGDLSHFYQQQDSAIVTGDSTQLTQLYDTDSLFLHADTFRIVTDSNQSKKVFAYHQVKFYKSDLQGKCDSMIYSFADSVIRLYTDPVIWSGENQLTADYMEIRTANNKINTIFMDQNSFIISQVDSVRYNQIRGKVITGYFINNDLSTVDVRGNGQTIYYSLDEQDKFIGVNRGESSDLLIRLKDNKLQTITFINDPDATFYPIMELKPEELRLKDFIWRKTERPLSRWDIFRWEEPAAHP